MEGARRGQLLSLSRPAGRRLKEILSCARRCVTQPWELRGHIGILVVGLLRRPPVWPENQERSCADKSPCRQPYGASGAGALAALTPYPPAPGLLLAAVALCGLVVLVAWMRKGRR